MDYSHQRLPETDSDWCSLVVRSSDTNARHDRRRDLHVDYVMSIVEQSGVNTAAIIYDNTTGKRRRAGCLRVNVRCHSYSLCRIVTELTARVLGIRNG